MEKTKAQQIIGRNLIRYHYKILTNPIIDLAKLVYRELSWGWNESVYREAFALELIENGYKCGQEITKPIIYKGRELSHVNARLDLLIEKGESKIVIELKADSASKLTMTKASQQCKRYLGLTNFKYGLVINFPEKENKEIEVVKINLLNKVYRIKLSNKVSIPKKISGVKNYLYNKKNRELAIQNNPELEPKNITSFLSRQWKTLTPEQQRIWEFK